MKDNIIKALVTIMALAAAGCQTTTPSDGKLNVPLMHKYSDKLVYTIESDFDKAILQKDCESWNGQFNNCGTVCDDLKQEVMCIDVCAYTCDHIVP